MFDYAYASIVDVINVKLTKALRLKIHSEIQR